MREGSTLGWVIGLVAIAAGHALGLSNMTAAQGSAALTNETREASAANISEKTVTAAPANETGDLAGDRAAERPNIVVILGDDIVMEMTRDSPHAVNHCG